MCIQHRRKIVPALGWYMCVFMFLSIFPGDGYAQQNREPSIVRVGVQADIGGSIPHGIPTDSQPGKLLGGEVRVFVVPDRVTLEVCWARSSITEEDAPEAVRLFQYTVGGRAFINKGDDQIYLAGGVGYYSQGSYRDEYNSSISRASCAGVNLGAGVEVMAYRHFSIVLEPYRIHLIDGPLDYWNATFGVNVFLR